MNAAARLHVRASREKARQFVACEQSFLERRDARHPCEIGMRQDRTPDLLAYTAFGENRLAFGRMVRQVGMNLPIEIVQQRGDGPLFFILAPFARISDD